MATGDILSVSFVMVLLSVVFWWGLFICFWPLDQMIKDYLGAFSPFMWPQPHKAIWLIDVIVLGPLLEELIFRGVMRDLLRAQSTPKLQDRKEWRYTVGASFLFGACHIEQGVTTALTTFFMGMIGCRMYIRYGYLLPVMAGHVAINAISLGS